MGVWVSFQIHMQYESSSSWHKVLKCPFVERLAGWLSNNTSKFQCLLQYNVHINIKNALRWIWKVVFSYSTKNWKVSEFVWHWIYNELKWSERHYIQTPTGTTTLFTNHVLNSTITNLVTRWYILSFSIQNIIASLILW